MTKNNNDSRQAERNEKMIELRIRFWTNDISEIKGEIIPKHSWDSGVVYMERNKSHQIQPEKKLQHFHSLKELPVVIKEVLIRHGIQLHNSKRSEN
jgi:hypothetical protein